MVLCLSCIHVILSCSRASIKFEEDGIENGYHHVVRIGLLQMPVYCHHRIPCELNETAVIFLRYVFEAQRRESQCDECPLQNRYWQVENL